MDAQAYLLQNQLITFKVPPLDQRGCQVPVKLTHEFKCCAVAPFDKSKGQDALLASRLHEILFSAGNTDSRSTSSCIELKMHNAEGPYASMIINFTGNIYRDLMVSLGTGMKIRMEISHAQVEVSSPNPVDGALYCLMFPCDSRNEVSFTAFIRPPMCWTNYWNSVMDYKFTMKLSLVVCGRLVLHDPSDVDTTIQQSIKEFCPLDFTFLNLLDAQIRTDTTVIARDGASIPCHRVVLHVHSTVFRVMFQNDFKEGLTKQVKMDDMSEDVVRAFLAFLYYWCIDEPLKDSNVAFQLLVASHKYDIFLMEKVMKTIFVTKSSKWIGIPTAIELFFFTKNVDSLSDLKQKALHILKLNSEELVSEPEYKQLFVDDPNAAMELCSALLTLN